MLLNEFLKEHRKVEQQQATIRRLETTAAKQNVGIVREIGDGVAKIEGLTDAMLNEMIDFGNGVTGLALNLEETEVGAIILGDYTSVKEGQEVRTTGKLLQVPAGKGLLGRVVNALGQPVGTVFMGVHLDGVTTTIHRHMPGDRDRIRQFATISLVDALRRRLLETLA